MAHEENADLALPISAVSRIDVGRLLREVETLDEFLAQAAIRQSGTSVKLPRTSRLLDELVQLNSINPLVEIDRRRLLEFLTSVRKSAPVLHISFNADPSPLFSQRLMTWLRKEIHPTVLLQTGLKPGLGAGCTVRTNSKYFDFSLRENFAKKRDLLLEKLTGDSHD